MAEAGYNTNLASEFYVMSVLHRLGFQPHLTLGNKKSVDIAVVLKPGIAITIDVKAVAGKNDWLVGKPPDSARPCHFIVLVGYEAQFGDPTTLPRIWVLPDEEFLRLVRTASTGTAWFLSRKQVKEECARYENAWELLNGGAA